MPRSADDSGLGARLRAVFSDILELAQVRLELFTLEAREAFLHLVLLGVFAVGCTVAIGFGLSFLAVLIIALLWNTYRFWTLGVFAAVFLIGGLVLLALARARLRGLADMFAATRREWQRDRERLWRAPAKSARKGNTP
ncbi:MAG: phage holin family protein [Burkholderiaceae bacterium]|jgi:uncharacterized membrane protein YqjE|nr:phage holin family protein [Burkholderiaceae bacterium]